MNEYNVLWAAPAREDLYEIFDYIAIENSNTALKILDRIEEKVNQLNMFPRRGRIVPELEKHNCFIYREIIETPWRIVYKIEDNNVFIISVMDGRRNINDLIIKRVLRH